MSQVTVTYPRLAEIALAITATATVPANDETLAMAQAVRQFLRGVASGQLQIVEAAESVSETPTAPPPRRGHNARHAEGVAPAAPPSKGNGIRGAEGVLPEFISGAPMT